MPTVVAGPSSVARYSRSSRKELAMEVLAESAPQEGDSNRPSGKRSTPLSSRVASGTAPYSVYAEWVQKQCRSAAGNRLKSRRRPTIRGRF